MVYDHMVYCVWLESLLKANHSGYRDITISLDRMQSLPADDDVSSSFVTITDGTPEQPPDPDDSSSASSDVSSSPVADNCPSISDDPPSVADDSPPPNTQSMVPNLNVTATEVDLIMQQLTGREAPPGIPAPSIRQTPVDEASGKDHMLGGCVSQA